MTMIEEMADDGRIDVSPISKAQVANDTMEIQSNNSQEESDHINSIEIVDNANVPPMSPTATKPQIPVSSPIESPDSANKAALRNLREKYFAKMLEKEENNEES